TDRRIGPLPTERRVSYSVGAGSMPRPSRTFDYPVASADEVDLWQGLGIAFDPSDESSMAAARAEAEGIIRQTLQIKTVPDPQMVGSEIDFVAGDVFHAEPLLLRQPDRFAYLANDLESNGKACNDATDPNPGYRCFFERHRRRRQVLIAGSNDGQLHAFEAGRFDGGVSGGRVTGVYDRGTGGELFAHIPRPMLQHVAEMTLADHGFGIDLAPVADDVFVDPSHGGTPTPADREWRTVVFGGYRSGGPGIFALDLTQPDHLSERTVTNLAGQTDVAYLPVRGDDYVPSCTTGYSAEACGALPYPAVLWEFSDQCVDGSTSTLVPCDDDGNGQPDLGLSWSKVNSGRVRVTAGDDVETRYVVVFGGGIDPDNPDVVGNFLYMVDVETGETLYKRAVVGAVPGEPAAVDSDGDTFLDTVYVGTTAGKLYKADISAAATLDATTGRVAATDWALFEVFDTGGRPIFYPPAVLFVASRDAFALAIGTGERRELFADQSPAGGRLYLVLDDGLAASDPELPLTAAQFPAVVAATDPNTADNFLLAPEPDKSAGWVLELAANERLVSDVLAISGVLSFATFLPSTDPTTCAGAGDGSIYSLLATNANGLGTRPRSATFADKFVNAPRVIPSSSSETVLGEGVVDPFATTDMRAVSQSLQTLFPDRCRFGNFGQRLSTTLTDTGQVAVVEIPVCVLPKNWKEF
ncbi:MAG TPA: hypothetical protein VMT16_15665, partial [Thermoanaerobaculia bacterium]|nr:hypothetical protein [Thermoanaerobaculia bacterium]